MAGAADQFCLAQRHLCCMRRRHVTTKNRQVATQRWPNVSNVMSDPISELAIGQLQPFGIDMANRPAWLDDGVADIG